MIIRLSNIGVNLGIRIGLYTKETPIQWTKTCYLKMTQRFHLGIDLLNHNHHHLKTDSSKRISMKTIKKSESWKAIYRIVVTHKKIIYHNQMCHKMEGFHWRINWSLRVNWILTSADKNTCPRQPIHLFQSQIETWLHHTKVRIHIILQLQLRLINWLCPSIPKSTIWS